MRIRPSVHLGGGHVLQHLDDAGAKGRRAAASLPPGQMQSCERLDVLRSVVDAGAPESGPARLQLPPRPAHLLAEVAALLGEPRVVAPSSISTNGAGMLMSRCIQPIAGQRRRHRHPGIVGPLDRQDVHGRIQPVDRLSKNGRRVLGPPGLQVRSVSSTSRNRGSDTCRVRRGPVDEERNDPDHLIALLDDDHPQTGSSGATLAHHESIQAGVQ
jgi:hypothetical protein